MQLFFSYARPDRSRVDSLVIKLRQATGIEIWLDSDLVGGWPWWDKILGQLRSCDAVLAAVSRASVNSQACRAERDYATKLGKPILPVAVEHMPAGLIPGDVARLQIIDYTRPDETSAFRLAAAIFSLPKPKALPNPLPAPPALPQTRFANLNDLIAARSLSMEEQLGILARLEGALAPTSDPEDRETAAEMLSEMAKRPDLYETAARKMEALQAKAGSAAQTSSPEPQTSQAPSPSTPPPGTPPPGTPPPGTSPKKSEWSPDPWSWSEQKTSTTPQQSQPTTGTRSLFSQPQQSQPSSTVPPQPQESQPAMGIRPLQSQPTITKPVRPEPEQSQPTSTLPKQPQPPLSPAVPSAGAVKRRRRIIIIVTAIIVVALIILIQVL
jgi:hypothetical protein